MTDNFHPIVIPNHFHPIVILHPIVIPNEVRDLQFAANCGSLASLGMTKLVGMTKFA